MTNRYLPPHISPRQVVARLGLISDTHMPDRWPDLPETLPQIFRGVDLILHAGDVGELWVLDQLSAIAPVVAVHGNDEPPSTPEQLPHKQLITLAGQRMLVWHGHFADRVDEMESRRDQRMRPKLERIARHGQRVGAKLVHFGHWHIPLVCELEGVTLVNAGALASGNLTTRQAVQTAAIVYVLKNGRFHITHINLADGRIHQPPDVVAGDFAAAARPYQASILSPEVEGAIRPFTGNPALLQLLWRAAPRCWWGGAPVLTRADLLAELPQIPSTPNQAALLAALQHATG